jgi:hypothetical protein
LEDLGIKLGGMTLAKPARRLLSIVQGGEMRSVLLCLEQTSIVTTVTDLRTGVLTSSLSVLAHRPVI